MIAGVVAAALFAIAAPFVLYPAVLWLRARSRSAPRDDGATAVDTTPSVSLVICAHDEAAGVRARLENALALEYPRDRLEIVLASDGSTDATVEIAREFEEGQGVRVLDLPRRGKAFALDAAVQASSGEILAFSDANSAWKPDALRALLRPFADPDLGGVAGDQRYAENAARDDTFGERSYWSYDRLLKQWQSQAGQVVSATGAIYAVRRELYEAPPPDATDDFMVSTGVIAQGRRLVFAADACAFEPPAEGRSGEFRRKVRVITRGLRGVGYRRALLDPSRTGGYAFLLLLHKLWRRLTWIPAAVLLLAAPACWAEGGVLALVALGVVAGTAAGTAALAFPPLARSKPFALAAYGVMVNAACAVATLNVLRGHRVTHWGPERAVDEGAR